MCRYFFVVAILTVAPPLRAEVLDIRRLGTTYWTASDSIEFRVEFNRQPTFPEDYFDPGFIVARAFPEYEWISLGGGTGIGSALPVTRYHETPQGLEEFFIGTYDYTVDGNTWSTILPFGPMNASELPQTVNIIVGESRPFGQIKNYVDNPLLIDRLVMRAPVPEPSTVALVTVGLMAILIRARAFCGR